MGKKDKTTAPSGLPDETLRELVARALDLDPQSEGFRSFLDELLSLTWAALSRFTATLAQEGQDGAVPILVALAGQPDLALAAVEALSSIKSQESSQRLLELAEGAASREVRKAAGRGLHRLRSLGFRAEVRPVVPGPAAATVAPVKPKSRAWTGAMDGRGSRFLAISAPKPLGGIALILLLLNDKDGMKETHTGYVEENGDAATKVEEIVRGSKSLQVEVPLDYARFLVKEGRRRTQAIGRVLPTDYQVWKELIGEPEGDWERPPIYQELNAAQILLEPGLLEESGRLLDLKEFWNWHLGLDEMRPYAQELEQAKRPTLVLSEVAQEEREEKVLAKALEDLLDDEGRAVYKRRLEEMSYILLHTDREREAKWALAAAVALDQESSQGRIYLPGSHAADLIIGSDKSPFTRHPFFSRLLGESLEWALKEMSKGRKIITAG